MALAHCQGRPGLTRPPDPHAGLPRVREEVGMRFVHVFLVGYFLLVIGALLALWYGGVLRHLSPVWILISLVIALGLGLMLAISAGKPEITRE
jgi:hypothetical protein